MKNKKDAGLPGKTNEEKKKLLPAAIILTIAKYVLSAALTFFTYSTTKQINYCLIGICEMMIIFAISNIVVGRHKILGNVISCGLMLLYNIQMLVLYFGSSYVTLIMLTSIGSLEDLSGKALEYGFGVLLVMIFSFIPITKIKRITKGKISIFKAITSSSILSAALALELCLSLHTGNAFSPFYNLAKVAYQGYKQLKITYQIANNSEEYSQLFYSDEIDDYRAKNDDLPEKCNVILIMTEGLSQHIVDDERNIMPNLAEFEKQSLCFTDYYNHTAATFRGIIGQLYSGYQLNDLDSNNLVSVQSILSDCGYSTFFINTEPLNEDFTSYLNNLGFDKVIGDGYDLNGLSDTISDKDAYNILFDEALKYENKAQPFFAAIYTFGTHVSLYSPDEVYGDGTNGMLNKFYNVDVQLGDFLDKFNESSLADDTLIIFTADHSTYSDEEYAATFSEHNSTRVFGFLDEIPLCFYYKGITPETISVEGRNSLDLAPTILDYMDISAPNYFLGESLFAPKQNENDYDTVFICMSTIFNTSGDMVNSVSAEERLVIDDAVSKYYAVAQH